MFAKMFIVQLLSIASFHSTSSYIKDINLSIPQVLLTNLVAKSIVLLLQYYETLLVAWIL